MLIQTIPMMTVLTSLETAEQSLAITVDGVTLFASIDVYLAMYRYVSFDYCCRHDQSINDFVNAWTSFIRSRGKDFKKVYDAMYASYDPITKYDMTEHSADGVSRGKITDTDTPTGTTTTTNTYTGEEYQRLGRQGADSADYEPFDETLTGSTATNPRTVTTDTTYATGTKTEHEKTHTNDQTASVDSTTVTGNEVTEHVLTRSGNIGVTTSQQMIQSEIDLRRFQFLAEIVAEFAKMSFMLSWGVSDG